MNIRKFIFGELGICYSVLILNIVVCYKVLILLFTTLLNIKRMIYSWLAAPQIKWLESRQLQPAQCSAARSQTKMQVISYLHTKKYITYTPRGEGFQTIKCKINVLLTNTIYRLQFEFNNLSCISCRFEVRESILLATFLSRWQLRLTLSSLDNVERINDCSVSAYTCIGCSYSPHSPATHLQQMKSTPGPIFLTRTRISFTENF